MDFIAVYFNLETYDYINCNCFDEFWLKFIGGYLYKAFLASNFFGTMSKLFNFFFKCIFIYVKIKKIKKKGGKRADKGPAPPIGYAAPLTQ